MGIKDSFDKKDGIQKLGVLSLKIEEAMSNCSVYKEDYDNMKSICSTLTQNPDGGDCIRYATYYAKNLAGIIETAEKYRTNVESRKLLEDFLNILKTYFINS